MRRCVVALALLGMVVCAFAADKESGDTRKHLVRAVAPQRSSSMVIPQLIVYWTL